VYTQAALGCIEWQNSTLQWTAPHCNTLQHATAHWNTPQHTTTHRNTLQHAATHCNTLQHTWLYRMTRYRTTTGVPVSVSVRACAWMCVYARAHACVSLYKTQLQARNTPTYCTATHTYCTATHTHTLHCNTHILHFNTHVLHYKLCNEQEILGYVLSGPTLQHAATHCNANILHSNTHILHCDTQTFDWSATHTYCAATQTCCAATQTYCATTALQRCNEQEILGHVMSRRTLQHSHIALQHTHIALQPTHITLQQRINSAGAQEILKNVLSKTAATATVKQRVQILLNKLKTHPSPPLPPP